MGKKRDKKVGRPASIRKTTGPPYSKGKRARRKGGRCRWGRGGESAFMKEKLARRRGGNNGRKGPG